MYILRLYDEGVDGAWAEQPIDARLLREGGLTIGRDPATDWPIPDPDRELSRAHCRLVVDGGELVLTATGGNGMFDEATGARVPDNVGVPVAVPQGWRMGRYRLVAAPAPHDALGSGGETRTMLLLPPLGDSTEVPSDWEDASGDLPRVPAEGSLLEAFCEGAGLDASLLSSEEPTEIMRRAGAVYRQMVLGIGDLMAERDRARARYQLTRTTISGAGNNPFKWAPTQRLAVDLLLAGPEGFLSGPAALKASLGDIKRHLVATFEGLQASLRTAIASFAPHAIDEAVAGRGSLLKSRAALQMQEVEARHADLHGQIADGRDGSLNQAFVDAYDGAERSVGRTLA